MSKWKMALAAAFIAAISTAALAAGLYTNNLPYLIGNPGYAGFTTQAPTTISGGQYTGNEGVPVDTNLPQGVAPQTAALSIYNFLMGTVVSDATATSHTGTAAQMCVGGKNTILLTGAPSTAVNWTTPTTALCLANLPAGVGTPGTTTPPVGYTWLVKFVNVGGTSSGVWTIVGGTNVTITGNATVAVGGSRLYSCTPTSTTAITCTDNGNGV